MFLHYFTEEQRLAFLGLARQFILSDDRYAIQEWQVFDRIKAEWHLPPDTHIPEHDLATLAEAFPDRRMRVTVLLELIVLGYVDKDFYPQEHAFVQALATHFGIQASELPRFQNWVQRQMGLIYEARRLMAAVDEM